MTPPPLVPLPIDAYLPKVVASLKASPNLVLVAEPGAGKTTRVPVGVIEAVQGAVIMLQPRRVAARAAAERIAEERGWAIGEEVGYQVRFERRIGPRTRIRVVTEAILARQLLSDPELKGVGCVILDEFHERSIHSDLALALLREVQESIRPDLRIVVMSATLEAEPVAIFLGGAEIVRVPGRVFPVEVEYQTGRGGRVEDEVVRAIGGVLQSDGHVLAFLPGAEEIRRVERGLQGVAGDGDVILPLHGSLPFEDQRRAVAPMAGGRRKIILSTNIAETSLTIDGVRAVVDSGLARQTGYDPARGVEALRLGKISQASAAQRAGRAGRTGPGRCVRLWSAREQMELEAFDLPELKRVDLAPTVLMLMAWGVRNVTTFGWFEAPPAAAVERSVRLLEMLGAVGGGQVTALGKRMAELPVHPRLGRLLLDSVDSDRVEEGITLAALLSERDIRLRDREVRYSDRGPKELADSDLDVRQELLAYSEKRGFHPSLIDEGVDPVGARQVVRVREELRSRVRPIARHKRPEADGDLVVRAYPDRVCLRRERDTGAGLMVGGVGVVLAPESAVRQGKLFLALDLREDDRTAARQATVGIAHAVTEETLRQAFPQAFMRRVSCTYDLEKDKVVGRVQTLYYDLVLSESDDAKVDDDAAAVALAEALLPRLDELIERDEVGSRLYARMKLATQHVKPPDGHTWPAPPWEKYRDELIIHMRGKRRMSEFEPAPFLGSLLQWPLDRLLDEEVPAFWTVPTGNRIRIDYAAGGGSPVLAVRLQEMFGATVSPKVCGGRIPILLHLLSPGYKPVQVTQDLVSFWKNTYEVVRKELKVRYPKHAWPDDPMGAKPVAKGRSMKS